MHAHRYGALKRLILLYQINLLTNMSTNVFKDYSLRSLLSNDLRPNSQQLDCVVTVVSNDQKPTNCLGGLLCRWQHYFYRIKQSLSTCNTGMFLI